MIVLIAYYFAFGIEKFWDGLESTVGRLQAAGHTVLILEAVPPHPHRASVPEVLAMWQAGGRPADAYRFRVNPTTAATVDERLREIARQTGAQLVPVTDLFCPEMDRCRGYRRNAVMYFDDDHPSVEGATQIVRERLAPLIWPEG